MVSGWALRAGIALTQAQPSSCFSALPSFECARELQSCLQTFEVLFADLSYGLYPGSSPEGEPGSRARADSRGARPGREREPARDTPPDGPGTGPSLWAVRGVRSHSTERDLLLAPTESLGAGG